MSHWEHGWFPDLRCDWSNPSEGFNEPCGNRVQHCLSTDDQMRGDQEALASRCEVHYSHAVNKRLRQKFNKKA